MAVKPEKYSSLRKMFSHTRFLYCLLHKYVEKKIRSFKPSWVEYPLKLWAFNLHVTEGQEPGRFLIHIVVEGNNVGILHKILTISFLFGDKRKYWEFFQINTEKSHQGYISSTMLELIFFGVNLIQSMY